MKIMKFENCVDVEKLINFYGLDKNVFSGSGVYGIKVGCRGEVEYVEKVSDNMFFDVREVEDLINEFECDDEIVVSDFVDWNSEIGEMYVELWGEEDCMEYYCVEVK